MTGSQYRLRLDSKRRSTWPAELLAEAGLTETDDLVARPDPEYEGRVIIESRDNVKRRVRERAAEGRHRVGYSTDPAEDLLEEWQRDPSAHG